MDKVRYIKNEKGGYYVWAASCFSDRMWSSQQDQLDRMNDSVRTYLIHLVSIDKGKSDAETERIHFLLLHMEGEMKVKGGVGVRDLIDGYILLSDTNAVMHRTLFDG